jgi:cytoskeleton protein RodZ
MPGPGDSLRLARESRGLSLEDVARETRIRIEYLDAMERDDFRALPGDVYSRGFLRNYGSYLGLNAAEVIAAYDGRNDVPRKRPRTGAIATQPAAPPRRKPEQARIQPLSPTPVDMRVRYAPSVWLMSLVAFVLLIVVYLGYNAYSGASRQALPTPTPLSHLLTPTELSAFLPTVLVGNTPIWTTLPTPSAGRAAAAAATAPPVVTGTVRAGATPAASAVAAGQGAAGSTTTPGPIGTLGAGVTVAVSVGSQNAWMRVDIDGKPQFAGTLAAGASRIWTAQNTIRIRFARGDITSVNVNGVDKGLAADSSQTVVTKEWDSAGNERVIP